MITLKRLTKTQIYYRENKEKIIRKQRLAWLKLRLEVFKRYDGRCECCDESNPFFLSIDHYKIPGYLQKKHLGMTSSKFYQWLKNHGYPRDNFRLLCYNCNAAIYYTRKFFNGMCPHKVINLHPQLQLLLHGTPNQKLHLQLKSQVS